VPLGNVCEWQPACPCNKWTYWLGDLCADKSRVIAPSRCLSPSPTLYPHYILSQDFPLSFPSVALQWTFLLLFATRGSFEIRHTVGQGFYCIHYLTKKHSNLHLLTTEISPGSINSLRHLDLLINCKCPRWFHFTCGPRLKEYLYSKRARLFNYPCNTLWFSFIAFSTDRFKGWESRFSSSYLGPCMILYIINNNVQNLYLSYHLWEGPIISM